MGGKEAAAVRAADTVLLWLSREPADLEWLLSRMLPPARLLGALREHGAPRRPGAAPAQAVAALVPSSDRLRAALAQLLLAEAPDGAAPGAVDPAAADGDPEAWRRRLRDALLAGDEEGARAIRDARARAAELLPERTDPPAAAEPSRAPVRARARARAEPEAAAESVRLRAELARFERELAREHARRRELAEELDHVRSELRNESQRATELKKRLAAAKDPGARERELRESAMRAQHELAVLQQKFSLLVEERDDLRACLEDYDRFHALPAEEVPSFRSRPLLPEELDLKREVESAGLAFRVLVVGGGEPQHRHRDKLAEYAEAMGFAAEWRMAEYVSWHREMDKLAADMKSRFDAMVILHYNRTTFTRHARGICDDAGHKPCLTCRYEGFTSLRATLRECLRQLVAARA